MLQVLCGHPIPLWLGTAPRLLLMDQRGSRRAWFVPHCCPLMLPKMYSWLHQLGGPGLAPGPGSPSGLSLTMVFLALLLTQSSPIPQPYGLQHARPPCPSPSPRVCSVSCPLSQWCYLTISSSVIPFSFCLQSFPTSSSFLVSRLFSSGGQSIGNSPSPSASVLPMNIQAWFSLGLTSLISLQSKGLWGVFSSPIIQKHQIFGTQPSLKSNFHICNDYWKNHSLDYMDLCYQCGIFAF